MDQRERTQTVIAIVDFVRDLDTPTLAYQSLELVSEDTLIEIRRSLVKVAQAHIFEITEIAQVLKR